jgi:hypothetical protein
MEVSGQPHAPAAEIAPGTHWLKSQSGSSGEEKNSQPLPGLETPIIQPVAKRYTDWAIPARSKWAV